jgi:hypothetical protein
VAIDIQPPLLEIPLMLIARATSERQNARSLAGPRVHFWVRQAEGTTAELWLPVSLETFEPSMQPDASEKRRAEPLVILAVGSRSFLPPASPKSRRVR